MAERVIRGGRRFKHLDGLGRRRGCGYGNDGHLNVPGPASMLRAMSCASNVRSDEVGPL